MVVSAIKLGQLHHFKGSNVCRSGKPLDRANVMKSAMSFINYGWAPTEGPLGGEPLAGNKTKIELAIQERRERWMELRSSNQPWILPIPKTIAGEKSKDTVLTPAEYLAGWESVYCDLDAEGKAIDVKVPEFGGVWGEHRSEGWVVAHAYKRLSGEGLNDELPCDVRVYKSDLERIGAHWNENNLKGETSIKMTPESALAVAVAIFAIASDSYTPMSRDIKTKERPLGGPFPTGQAQVLYSVCYLDQQFPDLKIIERLKEGVKHNTITKVDEGISITMIKRDVNGYVTTVKEKLAKKKSLKGIKKVVENYFLAPDANRKIVRKLLSKVQITALRDHDDCPLIVKLALHFVLTGEMEDAKEALLNDSVRDTANEALSGFDFESMWAEIKANEVDEDADDDEEGSAE